MLNKLLRSNMKVETLRPPLEDVAAAMTAATQLKEIKSVRRLPEAEQFLKPHVKVLRDKVKVLSGLPVLMHTKLKRGYLEESFVELPKYDALSGKPKERRVELLAAYAEYIKEKKRERVASREIAADERTCLGFKYKTTGSVFSKPGSVVALQSQESQMERIKTKKVPSKTSKTNYIGVELEFISRLDKTALEKKLCKAYLGGYVFVHSDGSLRPENPGDHSVEIGVLVPDNNYEGTIQKLCDVLNSKDVGAYVNNSCGLHVHIDCRHRNHNIVYNNLVRVLPVAKQMVPRTRIKSSHAEEYCRMNTEVDIEAHVKNAGNKGPRYYAVNPEAYSKYQTIEVRLHSGTLNATKINMWIKTFLKAATMTKITSDLTTVTQYMNVLGMDVALADYMMQRIKLFADKGDAIDTRTDHFIFNDLAV